MQSEIKQKRTTRVLWAVILLLALALLALGGYAVALRGQTVRMELDPNVQVGVLSGDTATLEELQQQVDEGMLSFGINATPQFAKDTLQGNLMVENPPENGSRFKVSVYRNDTGEKIYESGAVEPGQYLETVTLSTALEKGEYPCTAYFDAYNLADEGYLGRAGAEITVYILE